jgi:MFS superfamily sulfate permease-like transporter
LGRVPGVPGAYSDLDRHPENIAVPGVLIVRPDAQLYYANALTVRDRVKAMIGDQERPPRAVVFDMSAQDQLDLTSAKLIASFTKELAGKGVIVCLAEVHSPVLAEAGRTGLLEFIGEERVFATVDAAVGSVEARSA